MLLLGCENGEAILQNGKYNVIHLPESLPDEGTGAGLVVMVAVFQVESVSGYEAGTDKVHQKGQSWVHSKVWWSSQGKR